MSGMSGKAIRETLTALRVQDTEGDWKTLTSPSIEGDSIAAFETVRLERLRTTSMLMRTALADVTGMEARRVAGDLTAGAIIVGAAFVLVFVFAVTEGCISFGSSC